MLDLTLLTSLELVTRLVEQSEQFSWAKAKENDGMIGAVRIERSRTLIEVYRRLGVTQSPEVTNRPAFLLLAGYRRRALCEHCRLKPPKGRGLQFWTTELKAPVPLPLMMAWAGAASDKVEAMLLECIPLCRKCASKRGGKLLSNGNVDLKQYDIAVI